MSALDEVADALDAAGEDLGAAAPVRRSGRRLSIAASWSDAFDRGTVVVQGGHLHWSGATTGTSRTPVVAYGGQVETGYRVAFRWHYGRDPVGNVRPTCDYPCCLAGGHLADRVLREGGPA
ncbi:hypothetical protein [Streptomyces niveus]|uniref:hypothetical protein n=1 Tax=Streptomyces niveus TaxID=193462 RepID=UPI0036D2AF21